MIYLDNAATGGFKPYAVTSAAATVIKYLSANPGRSSHRLSVVGAEIIYKCRKSLASLFNASPSRVIFTKNCTEALNYAIFGYLKKGDHVITTVLEHNSVLRPLFKLQDDGVITLDAVAPAKDLPLSATIADKITDKTAMIAVTAVSNVTGETTPYGEIGSLAKKHGVAFLLDAAQGGGHVDIDVKRDGITFLALAAHKGLYGIMGSGALVLNDDAELRPCLYGGTGIDTFNREMPKDFPERLEAGTLNLPAIAALAEGAEYIKTNFDNFGDYLFNCTRRTIDRLSEIQGVTLYSKPNRSGLVSFSVGEKDSAEIADVLNAEYDVAVRGGFHCAPLMHRFLKTDASGLVRASLAAQNTQKELARFCDAVSRIADCKN